MNWKHGQILRKDYSQWATVGECVYIVGLDDPYVFWRWRMAKGSDETAAGRTGFDSREDAVAAAEKHAEMSAQLQGATP